jgi:t-SNARE complex subunit (syntaxin)
MNIHGYKKRLSRAKDLLKEAKIRNWNTKKIEEGMDNLRRKIKELREERNKKRGVKK